MTKQQYPLNEVREAQVEQLHSQRQLGQHTLELIRQSTLTISAAEQRGRALADLAHEIASKAVAQIQAAEAQITSLEDELRLAQSRAAEAEKWLDRILDEVQGGLSDLCQVRDDRAR
jgi:hypothetical protein